jgi:hypothetical protein
VAAGPGLRVVPAALVVPVALVLPDRRVSGFPAVEPGLRVRLDAAPAGTSLPVR